TKKILEEMTNKGIFVRFSSPRGLVEEAPGAYKNIDNVINIVQNAGLSKKVAKLKPLAVIKGE
ncbi:MAG: RtcB family protein, partial [Candidatus Pacebacteria bacterium]|nr:RtcB family protein [Candidatus Paceibacterota bacterium]